MEQDKHPPSEKQFIFCSSLQLYH